jgi:extracellular elastinolytic metalloproteinase
VTIRFAANLASKTNGATATGDATAVTTPKSAPPGQEVLSERQVLDNLIDDTEGTAWQAAAREDAGPWSVAGRRVDIDLRGTAPQTVRRVQVSAMLGPVFDTRASDPADLLQSRFTALRRFQVLACNAAVADCATDAG